jgi:hydroxymethylpyrimidine pyrophosphatase-like HAD family hydrolase
MLEILPYGASKGEGVKKLLEHYSLDRNHTIAFGDGENDVEMLQLVGLGVAVDNAREKLKRVATALTLSNNDDGVAHVLDMIVSNMKLVSDIEGNS